MKKHEITIDINRLNVGQLEELKKMTYYNGQMQAAKEICDMIAFIQGWMSEELEDAYRKEWL